MWKLIKPRAQTLWLWQLSLLALLFAFWHVMTVPGLIPPILFADERQAAFFFGEPLKIFVRVWAWFVRDADIYQHLGVTLTETLLAFAIGSALGLAGGLWLALAPLASALLEPYIKAFNAMPRIILAPIFAVWFGLGMGSKVALGVTLVFFIVFFNVYQGVKEVSPVRAGASCCARSTCPARRVGSSVRCTLPSVLPLSAPWSANTWAPARVWAT